MKRPSVKACQTIHAKKRALERYNLKLNKKDIMSIVKSIIQGKATFLQKQSCSRSVFITNHNGIDLRVVYDKNRKSLRTILPMPRS